MLNCNRQIAYGRWANVFVGPTPTHILCVHCAQNEILQHDICVSLLLTYSISVGAVAASLSSLPATIDAVAPFEHNLCTIVGRSVSTLWAIRADFKFLVFSYVRPLHAHIWLWRGNSFDPLNCTVFARVLYLSSLNFVSSSIPRSVAPESVHWRNVTQHIKSRDGIEYVRIVHICQQMWHEIVQVLCDTYASVANATSDS